MRTPGLLVAACLSLALTGCGAEQPSDSRKPSQSSASAQTQTADFRPAAFDALVPAASKAFATLTGGTKPTDADRHKLKDAITVVTFDGNGQWAEEGRFGLFARPGGTIICISDFAENVSLAIWWDHDEADGRSAKVLVFDWSNCKTERFHGAKGKQPHVWVDATHVRPGDVRNGEEDLYAHLAELIEANTIKTNIRAHFL